MDFKDLGAAGLKVYAAGKFIVVNTQTGGKLTGSFIQPGVNYALSLGNLGSLNFDLSLRTNGLGADDDSSKNISHDLFLRTVYTLKF